MVTQPKYHKQPQYNKNKNKNIYHTNNIKIVLITNKKVGVIYIIYK